MNLIDDCPHHSSGPMKKHRYFAFTINPVRRNHYLYVNSFSIPEEVDAISDPFIS